MSVTLQLGREEEVVFRWPSEGQWKVVAEKSSFRLECLGGEGEVREKVAQGPSES